VAFNDDRWQTNPLMARLTGSVVGLEKLLNRCGWKMAPEHKADLPHLYRLVATAEDKTCSNETENVPESACA